VHSSQPVDPEILHQSGESFEIERFYDIAVRRVIIGFGNIFFSIGAGKDDYRNAEDG
jgi:hypothetical protein